MNHGEWFFLWRVNMCAICEASQSFDYHVGSHEHSDNHGHGQNGQTATANLTQAEIALTNTTGKVSYNWSAAADQISRDDRKWDGGELGTAGAVTYSFLSNRQAESGFNQLSNAMIDIVHQAMGVWSAIANVTFNWADLGTGQVYSDRGEIEFQAYDGNNSGWASYGWFGGGPTKELNGATVALGGDDFSLALHEIGHAIGLSHPGNYNGGGSSYAGDAEFFEDTEQYSVMSYWSGANTGADLFEWRRDDAGEWRAIGGATGAGLYDIAAIQRVYGANTTTYNTDTIYGFNSNTGDAGWTLTDEYDWIQAAIWDTGGIDTIDASGYTERSDIDLREESFSSLGALTYNLAIARGVIVENAVGGFGSDTILGNSANNILSGNDGADTLTGAAGDDTLRGGAGSDTAVFSGAFENYAFSRISDGVYSVTDQSGSDGTDTVTGVEQFQFSNVTKTEAEIIELVNGPANDPIVGTNGDDVLDGNALDNIITGGAGTDRLFGEGGNDDLDAEAGTGSWQYLYGGNGDDTYRYSKEDGKVFVSAANGHEGAANGSNDRVVFDDLNINDITLDHWNYRDASNGNALNIKWNDGAANGQLRIGHEGQYIEEFEFADGSVFNILKKGTASGDVLVGASNNDLLRGGNGTDVVRGNAGNDVLDAEAGVNGAWQYLYGNAGDDTYHYSKEDGRVFISAADGHESASDGAADRVVFDDLNVGDLTIGSWNYRDASNGNSVKIGWDDGANSGELRIGHEGQYIESFEFADGTVINTIKQGYANNDTLTGTDANDILRGNGGNDSLIGAAGNDDLDAGAGNGGWQYLYGGEGDDTYRYSKEDGFVFVSAANGNEGANDGTKDRVVFEDLNAGDLTFGEWDYGTAENGKSVNIGWNDGAASGELRIGHQGQYIEEFEFQDGTVYTWEELFV